MVSRLIILTLLAGIGFSHGSPSISLASSLKNLPRQSIPVTVPGYEPGSFTSPGYPSPYENNLSVEYVITAPEGHRIHFYAESFDLEESFDTLSLVEIDPVHGKVRLGSFYPAHSITTLQSNANVVRASFQTDGTVVRGGFRITAWSFPTHTDPTVPEPEPTSPYDQVVQVFANAQGVIFTSPGYPNAYDNNLQIQYHIHAAAGHQIRFDAQAYDLESGYDTLTFFERRPLSDNLHIIGSFDGNTQLWSSTEHVIAVFSTDGSETRTGFAIKAISFVSQSATDQPATLATRQPTTSEPHSFSTVPGPAPTPNNPVVQVYVDTEGVIFTSPGYPNYYANNLWIHYNISAAAGHLIRFEAESYDLESGYDTLVFYEWIPAGSDLLSTIGSFDTTDTHQLWSTTNLVDAIFVTDGSQGRSGFAIKAVSFVGDSTTPASMPSTTGAWAEPTRAPSIPPTTRVWPDPTTEPDIATEATTADYDTYTSDPPHGTTEPSHVDIFVDELNPVILTSPGYPDYYQNNVRMDYSISAPQGCYLQFDVEYLNLEQCCDSVKFYEYPPNGQIVTLKDLGPTGSGAPFRSTMNFVHAVFQTDHNNRKGGFRIRIRSVRMGTK